MRKLSQYLMNKMKGEQEEAALRFLYNGTITGHKVYTDELKNIIRLRRKAFVKSGVDPLAYKLHEFGNSGNWVEHKLEELNRKVFDDNRVSKKDKHISVEIECIFSDNRDKEHFIKSVGKMKLRDNVCVKDDGSIHVNCDDCDRDMCEDDRGEDSCSTCSDDRYYSAEIVVTCLRSEFEQTIANISRSLNENGAFVNMTCGLHVHFDMRDKSEMEVNKIVRRLGKYVPNLKKVLPKSRRDNQFVREDYSETNSRKRYAFINGSAWQRHKTIEVRGHSGTISSVKIINWVKLIELLIENSDADTQAFFQMLADINCPNDLYDYFKGRFAKFKGNRLEEIPGFTHFELESESSEESEAA